MHEAFALPTGVQPVPGPIIAKQPPDSIEELPPDEKPAGDNVQWIPGYWAWDDEANDFLWVSGFWRDIPPGQRWIPGHWQAVQGGFVWVAGLWTQANTTEVQYLPAPPPTLDQGPAQPAPDANSIYVPGTWVYQAKYLWRPGHWIAYKPGWVWVPASYVWTPSGYIFIDGYWDHPLDQRGLLFAPVRFNLQTFLAARRPFIPLHTVVNDFLIGALFVRPVTRHYYFGDYFEPRYDKLGFVAWPNYQPVKGAFDPTFAYYRHLHAADARWEPAIRGLYTGRRAGDIPRPPQTLVKQTEIIKNITVNKTATTVVNKNVNITHVQNVTALNTIKEVPKTHVTNLGAIGGGAGPAAREIKLEAISKEAQLREAKAAEAMRAAAQQRHDAEAHAFAGGKAPLLHTDPAHSLKLELPKTPAPIAPARPPVKVVPPAINMPKHEERPIPKFEPPKPLLPPRAEPKKK